MIFGIVIGLLVWFVVPILFENSGKKKKKKQQKAVAMTCRIIGINIIVVSVLKHFVGL